MEIGSWEEEGENKVLEIDLEELHRLGEKEEKEPEPCLMTHRESLQRTAMNKKQKTQKTRSKNKTLKK
jgi:hypothetical protein